MVVEEMECLRPIQTEAPLAHVEDVDQVVKEEKNVQAEDWVSRWSFPSEGMEGQDQNIFWYSDDMIMVEQELLLVLVEVFYKEAW